MIFLSHNSKDKPVVEQIAAALAAEFGRAKVFYDSWSMQPGDGVIGKMSEGLTDAKFLFLFVSKNSLASEMVTLEWQNAVYKSVKGDLKIVPVRLDDAPMPAILAQTLYVDVVNHGLEVATRQIIDVVNGVNTYRAATERFDNVRAYRSFPHGKTRIEFRVEAYMEPQSRYLLLFPDGTEQPAQEVIGDVMSEIGFQAKYDLNNGSTVAALLVAVSRATSPRFPVVVELPGRPEILGAMRAVSNEKMAIIPLIDEPPPATMGYVVSSLSTPREKI